MKRRVSKIMAALSFVVVGILLSCGAFLAWIKMYPQDVDPKNVEYVLWTHGLNLNMNLDHALDAMTHDRWPERLVLGSSKAQLQQRFGYILTPEEPHPRGCYAWGSPASLGEGKETVFLRDSRWAVLLDHGKAIDLRLCKG
jgi:hypothetical protein